jgi:hypothetical protein
VITGGPLASRKGVHLPAHSITAPTFRDKDRDDLAFGLRYGVDYVALSTVRTAGDVLEAREMIQHHGSTVPLIAKIETADAPTNIDEIIGSADGVMVARGDLGVAIPLATVTTRGRRGPRRRMWRMPCSMAQTRSCSRKRPRLTESLNRTTTWQLHGSWNWVEVAVGTRGTALRLCSIDNRLASRTRAECVVRLPGVRQMSAVANGHETKSKA